MNVQEPIYLSPCGHCRDAKKKCDKGLPCGFCKKRNYSCSVQRSVKTQKRSTPCLLKTCDACRVAKRKCDNRSPCDFCKENDYSCHYSMRRPAHRIRAGEMKRLAEELKLLKQTSRRGQSSTASNSTPEPSGDKGDNINRYVKNEATSMQIRRLGLTTKVQGHQTYIFADINMPVCLGLPKQSKLLYVLNKLIEWASEHPEAEKCERALLETLLWVKSMRRCMDESPLKRHLGIWGLYGQGIAVRSYGIVLLVGKQGHQWVVSHGNDQQLVDEADIME